MNEKDKYDLFMLKGLDISDLNDILDHEISSVWLQVKEVIHCNEPESCMNSGVPLSYSFPFNYILKSENISDSLSN